VIEIIQSINATGDWRGHRGIQSENGSSGMTAVVCAKILKELAAKDGGERSAE
jgi:hypothetical protein